MLYRALTMQYYDRTSDDQYVYSISGLVQSHRSEILEEKECFVHQKDNEGRTKIANFESLEL